MTKVIPATVGAQITILVSKSGDSSNRSMTKVLPGALGAQIAILVSESDGLYNQSITSHSWSSDSNSYKSFFYFSKGMCPKY